MYTYTLCDLDNNQTRCYSDCRYDSSPHDHAHNYVTSAWSSIDENFTTSGNENADVGDGVYWQLRDTDLITGGHGPLDVTYYCQCPAPHYEYAADDPVLVENVANWTYKNWKSGCRTFCSDDVGYTGSWGSYDDVILESRCEARHLSMYDETNMEYTDTVCGGRRHPAWNHSQVMAISEDSPGTGNHCAASTGNDHIGTETFKWMTVRRGTSKYVHTGRCCIPSRFT